MRPEDERGFEMRDTATLRDLLRAKLPPVDPPDSAESSPDIEIESEGVRVSRLHREIEFGEECAPTEWWSGFSPTR